MQNQMFSISDTIRPILEQHGIPRHERQNILKHLNLNSYVFTHLKLSKSLSKNTKKSK